MFTARQLGVLAEAYSEATNKTIAALGRERFNDHRFFKRLIEGLGASTRNAEKASEWFIANWPDDAPWPDCVPDLREAIPATAPPRESEPPARCTA